jgi:hypothetical protein
VKRDLEFDNPIAERVIEGTDCTIMVQLGPPRQTGDADWYCPYRIEGIPGETVRKRYAPGQDAIEAIIYAICNIGAELGYRVKERLGLNWFDTEHLGFLSASTLPWSNSPEEQQAAMEEFFPDYLPKQD